MGFAVSMARRALHPQVPECPPSLLGMTLCRVLTKINVDIVDALNYTLPNISYP